MGFFHSYLAMSRVIRICPGVGDRKCGAFLSSIDRDPHPTCARCRGRICTVDMTCDICADWFATQWEQFDKKRSYKDRRKSSCPSGSVPPALQTSPRTETPSGVLRPGTSSRPLGGQGKQGGSRGAPGVVPGEAPSPPARSRSSERGGSVAGQLSGARGRAPASPSPSGAGEVGAARSRQTPLSRATASVVSPHSSLHVQRREESRETSESRPHVLSSRGSRSSDREARKDRIARPRTSSSHGRRRRSRSLSSSRSLSRGREHRRRSSSRSLSSRAHSRRDRSRRGSSRSRRDRSRFFVRYRSRRQHTRSPTRRGDRSDRLRSHALVTARGRAGDNLTLLPARGQWIQDGGTDEKPRRVLGRLPLSLLWFLKKRWRSLLLQEGLL